MSKDKTPIRQACDALNAAICSMAEIVNLKRDALDAFDLKIKEEEQKLLEIRSVLKKLWNDL